MYCTSRSFPTLGAGNKPALQARLKSGCNSNDKFINIPISWHHDPAQRAQEVRTTTAPAPPRDQQDATPPSIPDTHFDTTQKYWDVVKGIDDEDDPVFNELGASRGFTGPTNPQNVPIQVRYIMYIFNDI